MTAKKPSARKTVRKKKPRGKAAAPVEAPPASREPIDADEALRYRRAGMNYALIADVMKRDMEEVRSAVEWRLLELTAETPETRRALELERLDKMLMSLWNDATKGNPKAVEMCLKIAKERREVLAADTNPAPARGALEELLMRLSLGMSQVRERIIEQPRQLAS